MTKWHVFPLLKGKYFIQLVIFVVNSLVYCWRFLIFSFVPLFSCSISEFDCCELFNLHSSETSLSGSTSTSHSELCSFSAISEKEISFPVLRERGREGEGLRELFRRSTHLVLPQESGLEPMVFATFWCLQQPVPTSWPPPGLWTPDQLLRSAQFRLHFWVA